MRAWMAGAAGAAVFGVAMAGRARERRAEVDWEAAASRPGPEVELRGDRIRLPAVFHGSRGFSAVFGADAGRIAEALPTGALYPVLLPGGRAAVLVGAYQHPQPMMPLGDGRLYVGRGYGEVTIAAIVTPKPAPAVVPLFASERYAMGQFILHMPVTSLLAVEAGRLWGMPKFVADLTFTEDPGERSVELSEGGRTILTMRVRPGGSVRKDRTPLVLYSVRGTELLRTTLPNVTMGQMRLGVGGGSLELGSHEVARTLGALDISTRPFATDHELCSTFLIPESVVCGDAKPYRGYGGVERRFGRYLVRHANLPPIDQYAHDDGLEWWIVPPPAEQRRTGEPERARPEAVAAG